MRATPADPQVTNLAKAASRANSYQTQQDIFTENFTEELEDIISSLSFENIYSDAILGRKKKRKEK